MAQVITIAGERLFALKAQNNQQLDIDTFIFAFVPGQDSSAPIDRNEGLPPIGQRVHTQIVQQTGLINENAVVYSSVLDSLTGPFDFNWIGLYSSVNQTLVAINHVPTVSKTVTVPGAAGNILNRNFVIEYSGIAELTGIIVDAETWQLDYTARLNGMDELTRQLAADMNGKDWFIEDGFKVVPRSTLNTFKVTAGVGYVSGLRVELAADHILTLSSYPQFVYVDAWFDGTSESVWKGQTAFTVTNTEMDDYIDVNGRNHYVFKLARITAADAVEDLRNVNGLGQKIKKALITSTTDEVGSGVFNIGDKLLLTDRNNANFSVIESGSNIVNSAWILNAGSGKVALLQELTSSRGIDADWLGEDITIDNIKSLLSVGVVFKVKKICSIADAYAAWVSGIKFPLSFFSDSTADGFGTTGHIPSIPTDEGVEINESPNAYCKLLESALKRAIPNYPVGNRIIYNAGFDSQSLWVNNFALNKFDSIFIDATAPFKDTKMIGFAWGVTDVINTNNTLNVRTQYRLNLETLIVYSLAKGIQPFLVSPVPLWIGGDDGRNGWQLLSLIDEINKDLAVKYNLERLSLREAIEVDTSKNGNPLSYFSSDKVHPNDYGHSAIAGGLFKQLCPHVLTKNDIMACGSPKLINNEYYLNVIQKEVIPVDYDYFFTPSLIRFFVFLDEKRNLTANTFWLGDRYTYLNIASVTILNYNKKTTVSGNIFSGSSDFYDESSMYKLIDSKEFIAQLDVGLNEIEVKIQRGRLGILSFDKNSFSKIVKTSAVNYSLTSKIDKVSIFTKGEETHDIDIKLDSFHLSKGVGQFKISAKAFNILNSAILFNISSDGSKYNYVKLLADKLEFGISVGGVQTKTGESIKISNYDTSLLVNQSVKIKIAIGSVVGADASNDTVQIKANGLQVYENIVGTAFSLKNLKQGYGIGILDLDINGTLKSLEDVFISSEK